MRKKRTTMDGSERALPHRSGSSAGGATDFFVCFTARPSSTSTTSSTSSAMRMHSSKALMSPGRGRDPSSAPALSSSLSRRLRSSGSVKGGQSPMFPSGASLTGRKKSCSFEAAEPSSPKVTCIGQVRVKAKKKVNSKAKSAMKKSRSQRGRECCPGRNQSWVHQLPLSICEALKGIGSEFSCFLPCGGRSLCGGGSSNSFSTGEEKGRDERRIGRSASSSSCGAVLARWVLAVQESEEEVKVGEKVEVGFLLREREEKLEGEDMEDLQNRRGEKGQILVVGEKGETGEEEAARVSVCIPPRNALLLMRCRSDPVRMAALANRFWGSPANKPQSEEEQVMEEDNEVEEEVQKQGRKQIREEELEILLVKKEEGDSVEVSVSAGELVKEKNDFEKSAEVEIKLMEEKLQLLQEEIVNTSEELSCGSLPMMHKNPPKDETEGETHGLEEQENNGVRNKFDHLPVKEEEKAEGNIKVKEERRSSNVCSSRYKERVRKRYKEMDNRRHSFSSELDSRRHSLSSERETRRASFSIDRVSRWSFSLEKSGLEPKDVKSLPFLVEEVCPEEEKNKKVTQEEEEEEEEEEEKEGAKSSCGDSGPAKLVNGEAKHDPEVEEGKKGVSGEWTELPDCLLMMLYEPKLSMEVSKETWVCGNDFLRWRPHHARNGVPTKPDSAVHAAGDNEAPHPPESISTAASAPEDMAPATVVSPLPEPPKATTGQQKLSVRPAAVAPYEPLVLTRCKSEPMRSSARLTPDACFWKDRHRPIGAAGIGF